MIVINFSPKAFAKKNYSIWSKKGEIHFDGFVTRQKTIEKNENGEDEDCYMYYISDIKVPPQKVTGVSTNQSSEELSRWLDSLTDEEFNTRRFFGHSHVNFSTNPSGTDVANQNEYIKAISDNDFAIFWIENKKGEFYYRIVDKKYDIDTDEIKDQDIFWTIDWNDNFFDEIDSVEENVNTREFNYNGEYTYNYNNYQSIFNDDEDDFVSWYEELKKLEDKYNNNRKE